MNRLESIKKNMEACTDWYVDNNEFLTDMEYLLQRLERYEKALESVVNAGARETMRRYAEEALKEE